MIQMICSVDFQNAYVELYTLMRNYIWDLDVVEMLADVEVAVYDAFIDIDKLNRCFQRLYPEVVDVAKDNSDEEMQDSADAFKKMIDDAVASDESAYMDLHRVQETAIDDNGKEIIPQ